MALLTELNVHFRGKKLEFPRPERVLNVAELKDKIEQLTGIATESQKLVVSGLILKDDATNLLGKKILLLRQLYEYKSPEIEKVMTQLPAVELQLLELQASINGSVQQWLGLEERCFKLLLGLDNVYEFKEERKMAVSKVQKLLQKIEKTKEVIFK